MNFRSHHRCGGVCPHATGVRPQVTVIPSLVILRCRHWQDVLPVHHDNKAGFLTSQKLFDNYPMAGIAKGVARQHIVHGVFGFLQGFGDNDPFARGQAVGLDDNGGPFPAQVGKRRFDLSEILIFRSGDVVTR